MLLWCARASESTTAQRWRAVSTLAAALWWDGSCTPSLAGILYRMSWVHSARQQLTEGRTCMTAPHTTQVVGVDIEGLQRSRKWIRGEARRAHDKGKGRSSSSSSGDVLTYPYHLSTGHHGVCDSVACDTLASYLNNLPKASLHMGTLRLAGLINKKPSACVCEREREACCSCSTCPPQHTPHSPLQNCS